MVQNALFRQCLASVPEDQKAKFELSFGIAERISEVLKSKNLTQKDFAQKLHKRESEISKWMTGRHNFTMQTIAKIASTTDRYERNMLGVKRDSLQARYDAMCGVVKMIRMRQKQEQKQ